MQVYATCGQGFHKLKHIYVSRYSQHPCKCSSDTCLKSCKGTKFKSLGCFIPSGKSSLKTMVVVHVFWMLCSVSPIHWCGLYCVPKYLPRIEIFHVASFNRLLLKATQPDSHYIRYTAARVLRTLADVCMCMVSEVVRIVPRCRVLQ